MQMETAEQEVMCALLQTLLEQKLITKDIYGKARAKILRTKDVPAFFSLPEKKGKENGDGGA